MISEAFFKEVQSILLADKPVQVKALDLQEMCAYILQTFEEPLLAAAIKDFPEAFLVQIQALRDQNKVIAGQLEVNNQLVKEQAELEGDYRNYQEKAALQESLLNKKAALSAFDETIWKQDNEVLILFNTELTAKISNALADLNKSLEETGLLTENAFSELIALSQTNLERVRVGQTDLLETLSVQPFETLIGADQGEFENAVAMYNTYVKKIQQVKSDLETIKEKHHEVISVYHTHQLENQEIFGALNSGEGVKQFVEKLNEDISALLDRYDQQIRVLVEKRDALPLFQLQEGVAGIV